MNKKKYQSLSDNDDFLKIYNFNTIPIIKSELKQLPLVSIAIPTYKRADLLKYALDSALNQIGFDNFEVIVIDNNPERGCETERLMLSYKNDRISYYKNCDNIGMVNNWNQCINLSKSKWLTILHDDDAIHSNFLCYFYKIVTDNKLIKAIAFSICKTGDEIKFENVNYSEKVERVNSKKFLLGNVSPFPGVVFQKHKNLYFDCQYFPIADYDYWYKLSKEGGFYKSSMKLAFYRMSYNQESKLVYMNIIEMTKKYHEDNIIRKFNYLDILVSKNTLSNLQIFYESQYGINNKPVNALKKVKSKLVIKIWTLINRFEFRY